MNMIDNSKRKSAIFAAIYFYLIPIFILLGTQNLGCVLVSIGMIFFQSFLKKGKFSFNHSDLRVILIILSILIYMLLVDISSVYFDMGYFTKYYIYVFVLGLISVFIITFDIDYSLFFILLRNISWPILIYGIFEGVTRHVVPFFTLSEMYEQYLTLSGRIMVFFGHPIVYGGYLSIILVILSFYKYKNSKVTALHMLIVAINIFMCQSRSCILAVIIWLAIVLVKFMMEQRHKMKISPRRMIDIVIIGIVGLLLFIVFNETILSFASKLMDRFVLGASGGDQEIRVTVIENYIKYIKTEKLSHVIFGNGNGFSVIFMQAHRVAGWWDQTTDNTLISILFEFGFVGGAMYLLLFLSSVITFLKTTENNLLKVVSSIIIVLWIEMFFYEGLYWHTIFFPFGLCIVLMCRYNSIISFKKGEVK